MFLRPHQRNKDGKDHTYWSLVETVRTVDGPRQRTLCYLGELNGSAQARWLKSVEVFKEQAEALMDAKSACAGLSNLRRNRNPTASTRPQSAGTFEISLKIWCRLRDNLN